VDWSDDGSGIKNHKGASVRNSVYYLKKGITFSASGTKGPSFRILEKGSIFDSVSRSIFFNNDEEITFALGVLNSKLVSYIVDCLNPTVNTTVGDIERLPYTNGKVEREEVSRLVERNVRIKKDICSNSLFEINFKYSPYKGKGSLKNYLNYENYLFTQVQINESIINEKIFEVYDLTEHDKDMVLAKEGASIGGIPVSVEARKAYLAENEATKDFPLYNIQNYIESLPIKDFTAEERNAVESEFPSLYQSNNDLEEFCIRHQINPINVWYWFKQSNDIPRQRMNDLAMEFLADMIREILMEDEDGIIPLVANAGEKVLIDRIEDKFQEKGFSAAQFSSFGNVLGRELDDYLNHYFFQALSDHLNLFMYLPKTPFIWHLSSGPEQGFDCYIIIYKWNRDKLFRLKSVYIEHRERALVNRQMDLVNDDSAQSQNEKDSIYKQLKEIDAFKQKIDELLEEGYVPVLDDGVGKNIAPLQKKKMIPYEVLNAGQLKKYLNADW